MNLKSKAIVVFTSLALCASFVPALAIADQVDDKAAEVGGGIESTAQIAANDGEESVELAVQADGAGDKAGDGGLTAQADSGQLEFEGATVSGNTLSYEGGYKVEVTATGGTWDGTKLSLPDGTAVGFKFIPPQGYSGNASLVIDGSAIPFEGGQLTYATKFSEKNVITIELNPGVGPQQTREVKVTVDQASLPMLSSEKCRFTVGYGDDNDVEFTANGATLAVDEATRDKIILSFAINNRYFIPTAIVNGKTYETTDTGTSADPSVVNLCVELTGNDAEVDEFTINLSIGAQARVDLQAQSVSRASANYMLVENGEALVGDVANTEIDLAINDTATDTAVAGAVATFDIDAQVNGQAATTTEAPLDITMGLDTSVYTASDYVVVRNHEGAVTELATEYDATTGRLSFTSDQFSDYSLVDKSASKETAKETTKATAKTTLAKTGDPLAAGGMVAAGVVALGVLAFATRKLRERR